MYACFLQNTLRNAKLSLFCLLESWYWFFTELENLQESFWFYNTGCWLFKVCYQKKLTDVFWRFEYNPHEVFSQQTRSFIFTPSQQSQSQPQQKEAHACNIGSWILVCNLMLTRPTRSNIKFGKPHPPPPAHPSTTPLGWTWEGRKIKCQELSETGNWF